MLTSYTVPLRDSRMLCVRNHAEQMTYSRASKPHLLESTVPLCKKTYIQAFSQSILLAEKARQGRVHRIGGTGLILALDG